MQLMIMVMVQTGMRVSELVNFKPPWINDKDKYVRIQSNKTPIEWKPKRDSVRSVPITDSLLSTLKRHIGKRKKGYLFQSQKTKSTIIREGKKITKKTFQRYSYRSIIKKTNKLFFKTFGYKPKDESTHIFRSTFASHLLKEKLDIESIRKLLGHSNIKTTWIYIRTLPDFSEWDKVRKVELMDLNIQLKI